MIKAEKATKSPSAHILKRSSKMRAEILDHHDDFEKITDVRVEPDEPEKATRIVRFIQRDERGDDLRILCMDEIDLTPCKANQHAVYCSHVHSAINKLLEIHEQAVKEQEECEPQHPTG